MNVYGEDQQVRRGQPVILLYVDIYTYICVCMVAKSIAWQRLCCTWSSLEDECLLFDWVWWHFVIISYVWSAVVVVIEI